MISHTQFDWISPVVSFGNTRQRRITFFPYLKEYSHQIPKVWTPFSSKSMIFILPNCAYANANHLTLIICTMETSDKIMSGITHGPSYIRFGGARGDRVKARVQLIWMHHTCLLCHIRASLSIHTVWHMCMHTTRSRSPAPIIGIEQGHLHC